MKKAKLFVAAALVLAILVEIVLFITGTSVFTKIAAPSAITGVWCLGCLLFLVMSNCNYGNEDIYPVKRIINKVLNRKTPAICGRFSYDFFLLFRSFITPHGRGRVWEIRPVTSRECPRTRQSGRGAPLCGQRRGRFPTFNQQDHSIRSFPLPSMPASRSDDCPRPAKRLRQFAIARIGSFCEEALLLEQALLARGLILARGRMNKGRSWMSERSEFRRNGLLIFV